VQQALDPVLKQIDQTNNTAALEALAQALQALAPRLSEAQAARASKAAAASLAWDARDPHFGGGNATEWARALVALAPPSSNRDKMLVAAIAYPTAAGPATEVLLDAIRADHHDAPAKQAGTKAALEWLAKTFPDVLRPPHCPKPLPADPDLECPPEAAPTGQ
jgi:hypothetical protein